MNSLSTARHMVPVLALAASLTACAGQTPVSGGFTPLAPAPPTVQSAQPDKHHHQVEVFTANRNGASVLGFTVNSHGNAVPSTSISGSNTGLYQPDSLAMDGKGNLYTADDGASQVEVFAKGADGNVSPTRVLAGGNTQLGSIEGLYVDPADHLWASNYSASVLTSYGAHANGNVAPSTTIAGAKTQLDGPVGMAMNDQGRLYAANIYSASVVGFAKNAKGNATPIVTLSGSNTGLMRPFALAFNASGELLVADEDAGVLIFAKGANDNTAPVQKITGLSRPAGVMADSHGHIWVADFGGNSIKEFAATANGNATPLRTIAGSKTTLSGPNYLVMN
ncbi:MAG TPA: NHL repeat-containing protein [Candidatus Baltobacteraceae bacterium]|nr:NHL repeat-containing protein [Candidatus Baltobacteraceae bacterium]